MCFVMTWWIPEYQMDAAGQVHAGRISSQTMLQFQVSLTREIGVIRF
jgi:hypothetical protein